MGSDILGAVGSYGVLALLLLLIAIALWRSGFLGRLLHVIEEAAVGNWQLALLGAAALALSIASGYTTFDGLRNFTSAPLLSALIAFGIQGVLLIVAWLIGETFATGMNERTPRSRSLSAREAVTGMGLGAAFIGLIFYWALSRYGAIGFAGAAGTIQGFRADWQRFADVAVWFLIALVLLALLAVGFRRGGDIARSYVQSVRLIARNGVLWVMLLACMGASVFFSFDSHFNAIFPAAQRQRAAEIRTLNQVGGIVADIGERARRAETAEAERLFETEAWKTYDAGLSRLALTARDAQAEIEAVLVTRMEERQRGIGEQQERIAGAERSRTALLRKRDELEAELGRIEPTVGGLEAELVRAQAAYDETRQAIAAKRIDASAEDGGVEGTGKRGKGPIWRRRIAELDELQRKLAITDEPRFREAQRRYDLASARIAGLKREIAGIGAEVARHKGQIAAAEQRIKVSAAQAGGAPAQAVDPARALPDFERARVGFRQQPDAARLAALQGQCGSLLGTLSAAPAAREKVRGLDCDPREVTEAAARLFAIHAGLALFRERCAGGSRLPQTGSTDELLAFGRKCLQDSGLVSSETGDLAARLQAIEMNRDDKAHRFVVTVNAVLDGNRLAYMALVLAIGVDSLIFMAGLFGAAAVRSPLSDVPGPRARSAEQLEAIVRTALGEDRAAAAELVLDAMKPAPGGADGRCEVDLGACDGETARRIRRVLVAGSSIGAVARASVEPGDERYLVRPELIEYLAIAASAARDRERSQRTRPSRAAGEVGVARPVRGRDAEIVPPLPAARIAATPMPPAAGEMPAVLEAADGPAPAERRLLSDARARPGNARAPGADDDRPRHLWEALLEEVASEARASAAELRLQAGAQRHLGAVLERIERASRRALDRAARTLARRHAGDEEALQLLGEAHDRIAGIAPALMLLPDLGLLDDLIVEAETRDEGALLQGLRALRDEIGSIDPADGPAWMRIARRIKHLSGTAAATH
jgi:hypothetical protein